MRPILDASAMLAFLQNENGATIVEQVLEGGAVCSAVNWAEVAQKISAAGGDWSLASALLRSYGLTIISADEFQAEEAAQLWKPGTQLSLADRFCLALSALNNAPVWTADKAWGTKEAIKQIR